MEGKIAGILNRIRQLQQLGCNELAAPLLPDLVQRLIDERCVEIDPMLRIDQARLIALKQRLEQRRLRGDSED